jgi:hypothetical protein
MTITQMVDGLEVAVAHPTRQVLHMVMVMVLTAL